MPACWATFAPKFLMAPQSPAMPSYSTSRLPSEPVFAYMIFFTSKFGTYLQTFFALS